MVGGATVACRRRTEPLSLKLKQSNSVLCLVSLLAVFREHQGKPIKFRNAVSEIEKGLEGV